MAALARSVLRYSARHEAAASDSFADHVIAGLSDDPKWLSAKYFYDAAGSELGRNPACTLQVLSKDGSVKTVVGIIGNSDCVLVVVVSDHAKDGTEDLFLGDRHIVRYIHKDGRLDEEACVEAIWMTFSSDQYLCAFFNTFANVRLHALILFLRHHWSNGNVGIGRIANSESTHPISYCLLHRV